MNKLTALAVTALAAVSSYAIPLAEARGKIDAVISDPAQMTSVMQQLSAADQKSFVADVNEAIGKIGSAEEKSAKIVNVSRAALSGAKKGSAKDLEALLAEIYATAPVETLCALNESLAKDVLNRAADPSKVFTDEQFKEIASSFVSAVNSRVAGSEDADVRGGFAALTMIRASNGTPASLADDLAAMLGKSAEVAKGEWFPEALAKKPNYDPMLAGTSVDKVPDQEAVMIIAGAQRHEYLLNQLLEGSKNPTAVISKGFGDISQQRSYDLDLYTRPRTMEDLPWNPDPKPNPGPKPYYGQEYRVIR